VTRFRASAGFTERWSNFDFAVEGGVATITLSRPEKLNALTFDVYADLRDLLAELPHRGDARVLVLAGQGRGFCSGGDVEEIIGELQGRPTADLLEFTRMTGSVVKAMRDCPLPIVAEINGVAAGAGSVLALASDFRLLARSATFAFLFSRVALAGADIATMPYDVFTKLVKHPLTDSGLERFLADWRRLGGEQLEIHPETQRDERP